MGLAPAASDLVVVVAMLRNQDSDNLVGNQVLPVCTSRRLRTIAEQNLGGTEMLPRLVKQVLDLHCVSCTVYNIAASAERTEWSLRPSTVSVAEPTISAMGGLYPP